jgi:hypothetical protein
MGHANHAPGRGGAVRSCAGATADLREERDRFGREIDYRADDAIERVTIDIELALEQLQQNRPAFRRIRQSRDPPYKPIAPGVEIRGGLK